MIQVYSQEKRMEKMPVSQYYLSKDTYQGVHFEIKEEVREEFDVFVRLHGACTAPDDSYAVINLTWPMQNAKMCNFMQKGVDRMCSPAYHLKHQQ